MYTILYIGMALIIIGFIGFVISEMRIAQLDRELFRQKRLDESFKRAKKMSDIKFKIFIFIMSLIYMAIIWQDIMFHWVDTRK